MVLTPVIKRRTLLAGLLMTLLAVPALAHAAGTNSPRSGWNWQMTEEAAPQPSATPVEEPEEAPWVESGAMPTRSTPHYFSPPFVMTPAPPAQYGPAPGYGGVRPAARPVVSTGTTVPADDGCCGIDGETGLIQSPRFNSAPTSGVYSGGDSYYAPSAPSFNSNPAMVPNFFNYTNIQN
jgi:hypothetical protein